MGTLLQRKLLVNRTLETEDQDAIQFLKKIKGRMERQAQLLEACALARVLLALEVAYRLAKGR